jgi:teichuronic acid biosynthesis glycosyltransferase TuaC
MKRILIFSQSYYPRFLGGAEVALKELTDRLADEYEFDMVTVRKDAPLFDRIAKVNVHRVGMPSIRARNSRIWFPAKLLFPFRASLRARKLHKTRQYDLVWGMMAGPAGFAALLFKIMHPRVPFLLSLQEGEPIPDMKRRTALVYPFFRMIFTRANMIQAISRYLAEFGRSMRYPGKVAVIPNGVDLVRFGKPHGRVLKPEEVVLVTTSRLVSKNAVDDVIRAVALLPEHVHFYIYGKGTNSALRSLAQRLNVYERVHFMGHLDHDQLPDALAAADIFVRPSRSEGLGNSFIEAMAAGLPVIATQEGGLAEFLFDERRNPHLPTTGWAVDADAPAQVADAVKEIIADPKKRERVRANALMLVKEKYDWNKIAVQMNALLETLIEATDRECGGGSGRPNVSKEKRETVMN